MFCIPIQYADILGIPVAEIDSTMDEIPMKSAYLSWGSLKKDPLKFVETKLFVIFALVRRAKRGSCGRCTEKRKSVTILFLPSKSPISNTWE